jgi:transposase
MTEEGTVLDTVRIDNDPIALSLAIAEAGPNPEVALEATYGWYWAADVLAAEGAKVHLVHPLGLHWNTRRVKNDEKDATELAHRLRRNDLPEAWIAPPKVRELRELVRHRAKLVALRSGLKAQVHAVMAKQGVLPALGDMFGPGGRRQLGQVGFDDAYRMRVECLLGLIDVYDREVKVFEAEIRSWLVGDAGYHAIQAIEGVGPVMASIFCAEIGDVHRFPTARHLCSWAGLTPKHEESDTKINRGSITKQGNHLLRWAAVEAVARYRGGPAIKESFHQIAERRGKFVAKVAAARKLLTLVYYGLRDGEIRCLAPALDAG